MEKAFVALFEQALQDSLGEQFVVNTQLPNSQTQRTSAAPDLVVWPRDGSKGPVMVELKMIDKDFDLPLSFARQTRRMIEENQGLQPTLIVATTGHVGNLLRQELENQDVAVVQSEVPAKLADDLSELIRQRFQAA